MNKRAGRLLHVACMGLAWSNSCWATPELNLDAIRNYVENALEQLLAIGNEYDKLARDDINSIKERVIAASTKPTMWERMFRINIERTADDVQNNVYAGITDFVEQQSYKFAFEKTNNAYIASKVSKNMRDFIAKRITQTGEFRPGALSRFVGQRFRDAISEQCNRFSAVHDTTSMRIVKCRICWEKFVESECIALSPCGHIVCRKCAHEYFFGRQGMARCPRCTKPVDLNELREKLYAPSAPPMD